MYLSQIYSKEFWMLVYHTQPNSPEVELITNKFFDTREAATKWFYKNKKVKSYISPEVVKCIGLRQLELDSSTVFHL